MCVRVFAIGERSIQCTNKLVNFEYITNTTYYICTALGMNGADSPVTRAYRSLEQYGIEAGADLSSKYSVMPSWAAAMPCAWAPRCLSCSPCCLYKCNDKGRTWLLWYHARQPGAGETRAGRQRRRQVSQSSADRLCTGRISSARAVKRETRMESPIGRSVCLRWPRATLPVFFSQAFSSAVA